MSKQSEINYNKKVYMTYPYPKANAININTHNSPEHECVKALVIYWLKKKGWETYSEAGFVGGGIADVFVPEIPAYVEILHTETDKMLIKKCEKYPKSLTQIVIYVKYILLPMKYEYSDCPHFIGDACCGMNPDVIPEEHCKVCPIEKNPTIGDMLERIGERLPERE